MSKAAKLAKKSETERLTAASLEEAGGHWDHAACAWSFRDGSKGNFGKHAVQINKVFSHYEFEVI
jgi:hypothetical protein